MSSFFTTPASQKKRKRNEAPASAAPKRSRNTDSTQKAARKPQRDDSISGSDSDLSEADGAIDEVPPSSEEESDDEEDETGAERRLKLAERYLANVKSQVAEQQAIGFDAEDVDRDLIAERLKEDVAETKGRLYRFIASDYDYASASTANFRFDTHCVTSIATCHPYAYTVSYDLTLTKWELPRPSIHQPKNPRKNVKLPRTRPTKLISKKGSLKKSSDSAYQHHTRPILCVAASADGKFVATGGADRKLIIWSAEDLKPLRVFSQHRDSVTSLTFRRGTNQLYTTSADRTIKIWSLDELAYVETLFGHQDGPVDIAALAQERCLTVGARDRTVRLWKIVDETQLVYRGLGGGGGTKVRKSKNKQEPAVEGSIDRVAFIDDDTFVTGSDNGALCLWSVHKKKPVHTIQTAHGRDPAPRPEDIFAEEHMEGRQVPTGPEARWITALRIIPYSDLMVTGSWDGDVRIWRITQDRRRIEAVGVLGRVETKDVMMQDDDTADEPNNIKNQVPEQKVLRGVINDLSVFEREDRNGDDKSGRAGLCIVAAVGTHNRLGRWKKIPGAKNGALVFEIPKRLLARNKDPADDTLENGEDS